MTAWAVCISDTDLRQAASLWTAEGVEVCADGRAIWLRGPRLDDAIEGILRRLPGADRFVVAGERDIVRAGCVVPSAELPAGPWQVFRRAVEVDFPEPSFSAARALSVSTSAGARITLRFERTTKYRNASAIVVSAKEFLRYAQSASQARLRHLTFAVSETGQVLIRGTPLPPLPGEQFVDHEGLLVPAGWRWTPAVDSHTLRRAMRLENSDVALFSADGAWRRIAGDDFVAVTRSAVRLSLASGWNAE